MSTGIKPGTRLWVATLKAHATDPDVVMLCSLLLQAWDELEELHEVGGEQDGGTEQATIEDEWSG